MTYLGRCQHLLRQGLFVADVCAYVGDTPYYHWGRFTTNWNAQATMAVPQGHGYDVITTEVLLDRMTVKDGKLVLPDGMSYGVLAVDPDSTQIPLAALRKIAALKKDGATVVFGKRVPQRTPGLASGDDEVQRLGAALWAETPTLAAALKTKGLTPDFEGPFDYTHRRDGETEIYFVMGTGKADCTFRVNGRRPELWNPVSGKIDTEIGAQATADGRTRVTLDLPQDGSMFVVFRKSGRASGAEGRASQGQISQAVSLPGPWDVRFQAGRGAPEEAVFETLVDWTKRPEEGIRYFSGTATYAKTIEVTAEQATRKAVLQLGAVAALAQVWLNGKDLGIVWTAPWQVEVTGALKAGRNELRIAVTNPWANRLVGDAALSPEKRITKSNMAFEKGKRTLKAYQGFASEDALQPSGLQGPVTLELF